MPGRRLFKGEVQLAEGKTGPRPVDPPAPKPYLSIAELAQLTPWTDQAIRTMISRGVFREGEHYFYVGRRPVFKWAAVVGFIEKRALKQAGESDRVPHYREQMKLWDEGAKPATRRARSK